MCQKSDAPKKQGGEVLPLKITFAWVQSLHIHYYNHQINHNINQEVTVKPSDSLHAFLCALIAFLFKIIRFH